MLITLKIENTYEDDTVWTEPTADVPAPPLDDEEAMEEWWEDHIYPLTGTGRTDGNSAYEAEIIKCDELPQLVGESYEW